MLLVRPVARIILLRFLPLTYRQNELSLERTFVYSSLPNRSCYFLTYAPNDLASGRGSSSSRSLCCWP